VWRQHDVDKSDGGGISLPGDVKQRLEILLGAFGSDSGSFAILRNTTLGWFLSRAISSRMA
jgi:hypothetical protein